MSFLVDTDICSAQLRGHGRSMKILLFTMAVLAANAAAQSPEPKPQPKLGAAKVTISKETTYLTGPLRADGWIDYAAVINERSKAGVTKENNAAVFFWQAAGSRTISAETRVEFFRQLGIEAPPEDHNCLTTFYDFLPRRKEHPDTATAEYWTWVDGIQHQVDAAKSRPWSRAEFPVLADWLEINEKPLVLIAQCVKRPKFYEPLVVKAGCPMWNADFAPELSGSRSAVELLRVRAWQDLLACHRLARLMGQRPLLINSLVSYALDQFASDTNAAFVLHGKLTTTELIRCRRDLADLPPLSSARSSIFSERLFSIDFLRWLAGGDPEARDMCGGFILVDDLKETRNKLLADHRVDWDVVFRAQTADYDETDKALQLSDDFLRREELKQLERTSRAAAKRVNDPTAIAKLLGPSGTSGEISQKLAKVLLGSGGTGYSGIVSARMVATTKMELADFAIALAIYHHDHGMYPQRLAELPPRYLREGPKDIFSQHDYIYLPQDGGYTLYSVGRNSKDDHGANALADHLKQFENEMDPDKVPDDLCIRSPK